MRYIISAAELFRKAEEILNDGMDYVEISLLEPDEEDEIPAGVHFEAFRKGSYGSVNYEEVDVIDPED